MLRRTHLKILTAGLFAPLAAPLAGCGGGSGGSGATGGTGNPDDGSGSGSTGQTALSFANVSVHDPAVIRVAGRFYIFGSHLAAAWSDDLMNWTLLADGVNDSNPLFAQVSSALAEAFAWTGVTDLWAPDHIVLADGKSRMYYCACEGSSPRSALGVAVADNIGGPYVNQQILLRSGQWGLPSEDGTIYDATVHPNVVDPSVFKDQSGKLWMVYGSYSGGIFILQLDATSGLPLAGQGYGKHLMGGNHARIEGAYVLYSPESGYYYLFTSFGGLAADGGYNLRVARSLNPDGPYLDGNGVDMATVRANVPFDDASIAPFGQKLMGNHQFVLASGETGTALGYVSPGHNSAWIDPATGQHFLICHTRFPGTGEAHEVRVHQMFVNADGWLVVAPFRHAPLSLANPAQAAEVASADAVGSYKLINHGKDISSSIKASTLIQLASDGSVSGSASGSWTHLGNNQVHLSLDTLGVFNGVLSRQWNTNASAFVVTFTAQSTGGVSLWGARISA